MDRDQAIKDIVNQLERLQIQQSELLERLGDLSANDEGNPRATSPPAARDFAVGDRVRIVSPGRSQPNRGTITKIGRSRSTVEDRHGTKVVRLPKNLVLESRSQAS